MKNNVIRKGTINTKDLYLFLYRSINSKNNKKIQNSYIFVQHGEYYEFTKHSDNYYTILKDGYKYYIHLLNIKFIANDNKKTEKITIS